MCCKCGVPFAPSGFRTLPPPRQLPPSRIYSPTGKRNTTCGRLLQRPTATLRRVIARTAILGGMVDIRGMQTFLDFPSWELLIVRVTANQGRSDLGYDARKVKIGHQRGRKCLGTCVQMTANLQQLGLVLPTVICTADQYSQSVCSIQYTAYNEISCQLPAAN